MSDTNEEAVMKTRTELWSYDRALDTKSTWVGYSVHATDGDIGKIDEMSTETDRAHIVVDTGPWIFGKKRLIPAGAVTRVDHVDEVVHVSMTKDQIKDAPDYEDVKDRNEEYYDNSTRYYGPDA
jgi:hypothetical protein